MLKELNIANVVDLDFGKVGVAYERELERAIIPETPTPPKLA